jgi:small-conductance mechanosensitive channel
MQRRLEAEEQRQAGLAGDAHSHAERRVRAYADGETVLRRALRDTDAVEALLGNWLESLRLQREAASVADRLRLLYSELGAFASGLWNFELMAVEDKIVVEGREIVGKRSVTVGQVGQVVLILVIGLWLTGRIAGRGRRLLFRRYQGRESTALLIHRLFSLLAGSALVLFALGTVNIPLTVFAFVGGALALGVGFGAQNILNNFISGLILLVERPIKVGDIVEVEGVRGAVTTIGSRCCHVRRFDGIDMLIPNSSFLEKNVTNWTLSDQRLRFTVTCRVAYGSVVHHVMALLRRAVDEHPRVQREPMPEVFVEQFGDSALEFRLDFWLDIRQEPNWQRVMSEVRVRIDELFREAGIAFAFPQRDVHVDLMAPVRVEWAGPAAEPRP